MLRKYRENSNAIQWIYLGSIFGVGVFRENNRNHAPTPGNDKKPTPQ